MTRLFKDVSSLQGHLKTSIVNGIQGRVTDVCIKLARKNIQEKVYDAYIPSGENSYDRTYELLDAVTISNIQVGYKYVTFEIIMDSGKLNSNVKGDNQWNQHASVYPMDVTEYIPLWIEEGTTGSLWDREGAHYMEATYFELSGGLMARELGDALRAQGWNVISL